VYLTLGAGTPLSVAASSTIGEMLVFPVYAPNLKCTHTIPMH